MGVGGPPSRPMGPRGAVTQPPRPLMDFGDQTVFSSPDQMQVCIIPTTSLYLCLSFISLIYIYVYLSIYLFITDCCTYSLRPPRLAPSICGRKCTLCKCSLLIIIIKCV